MGAYGREEPRNAFPNGTQEARRHDQEEPAIGNDCTTAEARGIARAAQAALEALAGPLHSPDYKVYSARAEDDKPLTFLTKGDAGAWLNGVHATISRGEWLPPVEAVRRRLAAAEAAAARDVTFRECASGARSAATEPGKGGKLGRPGTVIAYRGRVRNYLMTSLRG